VTAPCHGCHGTGNEPSGTTYAGLAEQLACDECGPDCAQDCGCRVDSEPRRVCSRSTSRCSSAPLRIPILLDTPAAVRWLSCEPLLGPVNLGRAVGTYYGGDPREDESGIDWVVAGGESGPGARPMHPDWARSLRDQCRDAGVPFLFKQWGDLVTEEQAPEDITLPAVSWRHLGDDQPPVWRVGKKRAGRLLDGRTHDGYPGGEPS